MTDKNEIERMGKEPKDKELTEKEKKEKELREMAEAAEKAANAGLVNRLFVKVGQRVGIVEKTKIDPNFEANISKLIAYHKIIYSTVDLCEAIIQPDATVLANRKLEHQPDEDPWELIGGWLNYLGSHQYTGAQSYILDQYSYACGKIATKVRLAQRKVRHNSIRQMRTYTCDESRMLNDNYESIRTLLYGMDDTRHSLKSATTVAEVKEKGELYYKMITAYNCKCYQIQGCIDQIDIVSGIHQMELTRFAKDVATLSDNIVNMLKVTRVRINGTVKAEKAEKQSVAARK